jgi:hypothetical protein
MPLYVNYQRWSTILLILQGKPQIRSHQAHRYKYRIQSFLRISEAYFYILCQRYQYGNGVILT